MKAWWNQPETYLAGLTARVRARAFVVKDSPKEYCKVKGSRATGAVENPMEKCEHSWCMIYKSGTNGNWKWDLMGVSWDTMGYIIPTCSIYGIFPYIWVIFCGKCWYIFHPWSIIWDTLWYNHVLISMTVCWFRWLTDNHPRCWTMAQSQPKARCSTKYL
jgi:hypothetical protein